MSAGDFYYPTMWTYRIMYDIIIDEASRGSYLQAGSMHFVYLGVTSLLFHYASKSCHTYQLDRCSALSACDAYLH
jgi:hypothetical protein